MKLVLGVASGENKTAKVKVTRPGTTSEVTVSGTVTSEIDVNEGDEVGLEVLTVADNPPAR